MEKKSILLFLFYNFLSKCFFSRETLVLFVAGVSKRWFVVEMLHLRWSAIVP